MHRDSDRTGMQFFPHLLHCHAGTKKLSFLVCGFNISSVPLSPVPNDQLTGSKARQCQQEILQGT